MVGCRVLRPAVFGGNDCQPGIRVSLQATRGCCIEFGRVFAEKLQCHVFVDLSPVVRPPVEFVLRNEALPRHFSVAHAELDAFEHRGDAIGDWVSTP
jgi:hypothetical protein